VQKAIDPGISTWPEVSDVPLPRFGMEVELTMIPFATDADGNELVTFAFQPVSR